MRAFFASVVLAYLLGTVFTPGRAAAQTMPMVDKIVVVKSERKLTLMSHGKVVKTYTVALGRQPVGAKTQQGDHKTPEGVYVIDRRNESSRFHRALHISYPNAEDSKRAADHSVEPGGDIMLHGLPNGMGWVGKQHLRLDWTDGCIAVTNDEIEEIWKLVPNGTPIEIKP